MAEYDGSIRINTKIDTANLPSQMQKIVNSIKKAEGEVERLRAKMDALKNQKIPTQDYAQLQAELRKAEARADSLYGKLRVMEKSGVDRTSASYARLREQIAQADRYIDELRADMQDMESSGKAFTLGGDSEEYARMAARVNELSGSIQVSKTRLAELNAKQKPVSKEFDNVKKKAEKAFSSVSKGAKRSGGLLTTLATRFRGIMLSLLIFNWITKAFNAMISGMKKGFENLMGYSAEFANSVQSLKNSMATLGNQFAAAFAPIVQMVIPWLRSLINALSTAMSYVAQFIALLGGKSTFTRAKQVQDSYNKSLGGTASAAKKAYGALAKFDDLDVLQKQEDTDAGGGAGETLPQDMFEEVPVDPRLQKWLDGILERLKPILDYLKKLKDVFMEGFWDGLGDYGYRLDIIKEGLKQIMDALIDIWTDPAVLAAADRWAQSVMYMLGSLVGSVASIALTIAAAFIGGLGKYLSENTDRIKKFLISAFNVGTEINNLLADLFQSIAYIFEGLASESGIRFVAALIGSIADAEMGIIEIALKLGRDFLEMFILPITENKEGFRTAFEGLLAAGANALEGFKGMIDSIFDNLNAVYDAHFKPFFDSIANGLSEIVGAFLEVWNGTISPILQNIGTRIGELLQNYIAPFVNSVVEFVGNLATVLQVFWEGFLQPLVEWVITYVVPILAEVWNVLVQTVISIIELIMESLTTFMDFINNTVMPIWQSAWEIAGTIFQAFFDLMGTLVNSIKELFSGLFKAVQLLIDGDWKKAWETAKQTFIQFKEKVASAISEFKTKFENAFSPIISLIDNFVSKIQDAIQAVKDFASAVGDKISSGLGAIGGFFGISAPPGIQIPVAFDMPSSAIDNFNIPHLASGSVIRGGSPFAAILGDQPRGQVNIEAPLDTIRQAVREELSGMQYGGGISPVISLNIDGSEFARLTLNDILSEAARQGYDVSVWGVT